MARYHPALVALHWIMALMIIMALFFGKVLLSAMSNSDPAKVEGLAGHMTIGLVLGGLLVLRLGVRLLSESPPHAKTGTAFLDRVGAATHWVMYLLVALMVASGIGIAMSTGLFPIVFGASGDPLPESFNGLAPRVAHGIVSTLLLALLALHVLAALYHQFVLRDGLFRRMWFGRRKSE